MHFNALHCKLSKSVLWVLDTPRSAGGALPIAWAWMNEEFQPNQSLGFQKCLQAFSFFQVIPQFGLCRASLSYTIHCISCVSEVSLRCLWSVSEVSLGCLLGVAGVSLRCLPQSLGPRVLKGRNQKFAQLLNQNWLWRGCSKKPWNGEITFKIP